jgi:tetrathionate reductase subunit B
VYYRKLWRYAKCFIGGAISTKIGNSVECVEGARVQLRKGNEVVAETTSDNYGDFKFDQLVENAGTYLIEISAADGTRKVIETKLGVSINLGEIRLSQSSSA